MKTAIIRNDDELRAVVADFKATKALPTATKRSRPGAIGLYYLHNGRDLAPQFMTSVLATLAAGNVTYVEGIPIGSDPSGIVGGRNAAVRRFLAERPEEWFLWVDSDMVFEPDMPIRLRAAADPVERPIVGALCFGMKPTPLGPLVYPTLYDVDPTGYRFMWDFPKDQLVQVAATGSAAIIIHRSVFAQLGKDPYAIRPAPNLLEDGTPDRLGEDMSFCDLARSKGFKVFVDTRVKVGHCKTVILDEKVYVVPAFVAEEKAKLPPGEFAP